MKAAKRFEILRQLKRYLWLIASLLEEMSRFNPRKLTQLFILSLAGSTLQAFSLGLIFVVLRHGNSRLVVDCHKIWKSLSCHVHVVPAFCVILLLLALSVYLTYKAEKATVVFSNQFSNAKAADLLYIFPAIAHRMPEMSIDSKTGIPKILQKEMAQRCFRLELAARHLLGSPITIFKVIYAGAFLLFLEPWLTLILLISALPFLVPLKRFTLAIQQAEEKRNEVAKSSRDMLSSLVRETERCDISKESIKDNITRLFAKTGYGAANYQKMLRLIALAGSSAVAATMLVSSGLVSILYLWFVHGEQEGQLALIVAFVGALRIAVLSGRHLVTHLSGFARFTNTVSAMLQDQKIRVSKQVPISNYKISGITGLNMENTEDIELEITGNGPFALVTDYPVRPLNSYNILNMFRSNGESKQAITRHMVGIVPNNVSRQLKVSLREFLGIHAKSDLNGIFEKLQISCLHLQPQHILESLDLPSFEFDAEHWIELNLLKIMFSDTNIVVFREDILRLIGDDAVNHWTSLLSDRKLLFSYQFDKKTLGHWREEFVLLLLDSGKKPRIASVAWYNKNINMVKRLFSERTNKEEFIDDQLEFTLEF